MNFHELGILFHILPLTYRYAKDQTRSLSQCLFVVVPEKSNLKPVDPFSLQQKRFCCCFDKGSTGFRLDLTKAEKFYG